MNVIAWLMKNSALLIGVLESAMKLLAGIASLTPTKKDDKFVKKVDDLSGKAKKIFYDLSDKAEGKPPAA